MSFSQRWPIASISRVSDTIGLPPEGYVCFYAQTRPRRTFVAESAVLMTRCTILRLHVVADSFLVSTAPGRLPSSLSLTSPSAPRSPMRRKESRPVVVKRKHNHAVEIDMFEAHWRDESVNSRIDRPGGQIACARYRGCIRAMLRPSRTFEPHFSEWLYVLPLAESNLSTSPFT